MKAFILLSGALFTVAASTGVVIAHSILQGPDFLLLSRNAEAAPRLPDLDARLAALWTKEARRTEQYIIREWAGTNDAAAAKTRLLANEDDIVILLAPYYGDQTAGRIGELLKQNTELTTGLITALKNRQPDNVVKIKKRIRENIAAITALLGNERLGPSPKDFPIILTRYSESLIDGMVARAEERWQDEAIAFENALEASSFVGAQLSQSIREKSAIAVRTK